MMLGFRVLLWFFTDFHLKAIGLQLRIGLLDANAILVPWGARFRVSARFLLNREQMVENGDSGPSSRKLPSGNMVYDAS